MPGEPVGRNQIVSSSGIAVAALVRAWGGEPDPVRHRARRRRADRGPHRRRRAARPAGHPGRRLGRRPRPGAGRAQGAGLRHGFLAHRHAPGQAADVRRQGPRPRARPAGQSGLDHGLRAPVPEARDRAHAGPARRPGRHPAGAARRRRQGERPARGLCPLEARPRRPTAASPSSPIRCRTAPCCRCWPGRPACWCGRRTIPPRKAGDTVQVIDLSVLPGGY